MNQIATREEFSVTSLLPSRDELMELPRKMIGDLEAFGAIDSHDLYAIAAGDMAAAKKLRASIEAQRVARKEPYLKGGREIDALYKTPVDELDRVIAGYNLKMTTWIRHQEEEKRKAQAEADRIARAERDRIAAEATVARRKAELEAEELRQKAAAEQNENTKRELESQAEMARIEGEAVAAAKHEESLMVSSEKVAEAPKVDGVSTSTTYQGEVVNLLALVQYIAQHPEHINLIKVDQTALNALARSMKAAISNIPGCRAVPKMSTRIRA